MKQGNDPATHTPFINTESFIKERKQMKGQKIINGNVTFSRDFSYTRIKSISNE